ncbi:DUF3304 domain-containing protein [Paraburkholderia sp. SARCC-3016]|uniref:DUF3304 domain-containing protein n=1 Tax=Paraburkholderia sp. SARCC-3016 TaxID=3058611 RepID=UPI002807697B|nr:DUF3304 domain-containing protein [Paraburkholderia sp. SARCC-3016]MDQ7982524.1 DUF3304 domain-containing protein [Paraburkholderia sp. SARCC-3016]
MKRIICLMLYVAIAAMLCACASARSGNYVTASVSAVNYSEDYVPDFSILTASGERTGMGGIQVQEFSKGGQSGTECCAPIPNAGQTMIVEWRIGGRQEAESNWNTFRKAIVVRGETSSDPKATNYLVVRFFPEHQVEAEFMWERTGPHGQPSPRLDQLLYGRRVMRQMGD